MSSNLFYLTSHLHHDPTCNAASCHVPLLPAARGSQNRLRLQIPPRHISVDTPSHRCIHLRSRVQHSPSYICPLLRPRRAAFLFLYNPTDTYVYASSVVFSVYLISWSLSSPSRRIPLLFPRFVLCRRLLFCPHSLSVVFACLHCTPLFVPPCHTPLRSHIRALHSRLPSASATTSRYPHIYIPPPL